MGNELFATKRNRQYNLKYWLTSVNICASPQTLTRHFGTYFFKKVVEEYNPQDAPHTKRFNVALAEASGWTLPLRNYPRSRRPEAR